MLGVLSVLRVLQFVAVFILMYILEYALMLILRCLSFWLTQVNAFHKIEETCIEFSFKLPMPAIEGVWRFILFIILPYGLLSNMPSVALFGEFGLAQWLICFGVTGVFLALALGMWRLGRKRYDSASS